MPPAAGTNLEKRKWTRDTASTQMGGLRFFVPKHERMMLMILSQEGQTFRYGNKVFTVGGMVWRGLESGHGELGEVQEIHLRSPSNPTACCKFEGQNVNRLDLNTLEPVSQGVPMEATQGYVLSYSYRCGSGEVSDVLGISTDKSALLRLMLDHMTPGLPPLSAYSDAATDSLYFTFEGGAPEECMTEQFGITPVCIYEKSQETAYK